MIATPNHSGLGGAFFGGGGVYRDRLLFDWGTSERIIASAVTVRRAQQWAVARVLVIDNYDSFVYNLVQYLGELGAEPIVHRHDAITLDDWTGSIPMRW